MNEVKRKATAKYFEQVIWNNISKQNSFEDRRLNLQCSKIDKDGSVAVKSWDSKQLLMVRRNKKLREIAKELITIREGVIVSWPRVTIFHL